MMDQRYKQLPGLPPECFFPGGMLRVSDSCQNKILEFLFFKHFLKINLEIFVFLNIFLGNKILKMQKSSKKQKIKI